MGITKWPESNLRWAYWRMARSGVFDGSSTVFLQMCQIPLCLEYTASRRGGGGKSIRMIRRRVNWWEKETQNKTALFSLAGPDYLARPDTSSQSIKAWWKNTSVHSVYVCVCWNQTVFSLHMPIDRLLEHALHFYFSIYKPTTPLRQWSPTTRPWVLCYRVAQKDLIDYQDRKDVLLWSSWQMSNSQSSDWWWP